MKSIVTIVAVFVSACLFFSFKKETASLNEEILVIKANGNIHNDIESFKNMLGPLNTTPGALNGHREINWDGIPDSLLNTPLPNNFFNQTGDKALASFKRGITYASQGSFVVSKDGFAAINNRASSQFAAFSGTKTFANTTASKWEISFQKAGTTQKASVQAFGLVFSDVDKDSSASFELFNDNKSLGKYFVPAHDATSNFSFLGVYFKNSGHITKVIVSHDGFLAEGIDDISNGGSRDLVVLDDFIYSEPVAE